MRAEKPPIPSDVPRPESVGRFGRWRQSSFQFLQRMPGALSFGMTPLQAHVVIVGYPRSGSTMLYLMVHHAVRRAKVFPKEVSALNVAWRSWPNHEFLVSKKPLDTFWVDEIRESYRGQRASVKFIALVRDPRAVLTSSHVKKAGYFLTVDRWKALRAQLCYLRQFEDVLFVDYNDLVTNCQVVEDKLRAFTGWTVDRPFAEFHQAENGTLQTRAMNGVRPLERQSMDKWRAAQHRPRIMEILREVPELPEILRHEGYESNMDWLSEYR